MIVYIFSESIMISIYFTYVYIKIILDYFYLYINNAYMRA